MANLHLTACLLLYFQRRDEALGLGWQSQRVRGLLWYYRRLQERKAARFVMATFLNKIIQEGASAIKVLMDRVTEAEDKPAIARQVIEIGKRMDLAKQALDELTNDTQEIDAKDRGTEINGT